MRTTSLQILHVLPSLERAGTQRFVTTLAVAQARAGHRPTVVSLTRDPDAGFVDELAAVGVEVISLHKPPGVDARVPFRIRRIARQLRADVVHTHGYALTYGILAQASPRRRAAHTLHATMDVELGRATAPFYPVAHRLGVRFAAISDAVAASCEARFGFHPTVIDSPVDLQAFGAPVDRATVRRHHGLPTDAVLVCTVARMDPVKGVDIALEAFAGVNSKAHWAIAGAGSDADSIRRRAEALGVADRVHFLGLVQDVPALLGASDLFLLTSRSEGLGLSAIEALAAGLPCVVTDVGGLPEVVQDGQTGRVVPSEDVEGIAEAMNALISDGDERSRLASQAPSSVVRFSAASAAQAYDALYGR